MPMLASGHCLHHLRIAVSSVVASRWPCSVLPSHLEIRADALRLGDYGRVLALLWLESGQLPMSFPESDA
jgi:hypothetical protein